MKKLILIFLSIFIKSQEIIIIDSLDHRPISFCKIMDSDHLYVTDSLGKYNFATFPKESVIISSAGYEVKKITLKTGIVKLTPKFIQISEINISNNNLKIDTELGYKSSKNTIIIDQNREFAVEIKSQNANCLIDNVSIPFKKSSSSKGYLLVDIYHDENGKIGEKINASNYVLAIEKLGKNNILQLIDEIYIEKGNAIYISIIWVENTYTKSEKFANKIFLYTQPHKSSGKMFVRKSNYGDWDLKPYIENVDQKNSIIPALKIHGKCSK
ncbi:hypothetical protein QGN23_12675 [Chryseobacterium gotjawalense]|uniref:Carboxypeptidase-like regulatory domain-containing protein n=1 Tax=Chryseobacterium gotjawalense TaxID=3042315 RepID=A0ABY8RBS4_9FLAO|nr:hypothetical protein [Chryseobacterium sp. wdc7]WHF51276.1 hypothetical protein QGN23_12675 [Chryseobacterium sp. wdc7]